MRWEREKTKVENGDNWWGRQRNRQWKRWAEDVIFRYGDGEERRQDKKKKKHTALDVPPSFRSHTITFRNGQKQLLEVKSCDLHLLKK